MSSLSKRKSQSKMEIDDSSLKSKQKQSWTEESDKKESKATNNSEASKPSKSSTDAFTDLFWHLANISSDVRVKATSNLVETLVKIQKQQPKEGVKSSSLNKFTGASTELGYTLNRLIKGLLSDRDAARQGFSTALSEVLKYLKVDLKEVADVIIDEVLKARSNPDVSMKDRRIGFIFGVAAISNSGRLESSFNNKATQIGTIQAISELISGLLQEDSLKQVQLLEVTCEVLSSLLSQIPKNLFNSHLQKSFSKILASPHDHLQPEYLIIALNLFDHFGHFIAQDNPQLWNKSEGFFGPKNINNWIHPLNVTVRTVPRINALWNRAVSHLLTKEPENFERFVNVILRGLYKSHSIDHCFMGVAVATEMILMSNPEVQSAIMKDLPKLTAEQLSLLLSPEFMDVLFTHVPKKKSTLNDVSRHAVDALIQLGSKNLDMAQVILDRLTSPYGDLNVLDHFFKPAIVSTMMNVLDEKHAKQYVENIVKELYLTKVPADLVPKYELVKTLETSASTDKKSQKSKKAAADDEDEEIAAPNEHQELQEVKIDPKTWTETRRKTLLIHLIKIATQLHQKFHNISFDILKFVFFHAFYKTSISYEASKEMKNSDKKKAQQECGLPLATLEVSDVLRKAFADQFLRLVDALQSPGYQKEQADKSSTEKASDDANSKDAQQKKKEKMLNNPHVASTHYWILPVVHFEKSLLKDQNTYTPHLHGSILGNIRSQAEKLMASIEKAIQNCPKDQELRKCRLQAFQALLIQIHMLLNVEHQDCIQALEDLARVYEELFIEEGSKTPSKKTPKKSKKNEEDEETPAAMDVFIEILVSLLLKAHRQLRGVIEQSWRAFGALVTPAGLDIVLSALEEEQAAEDDEDEEMGDDEFVDSDEDMSVDDDDIAELKKAIGMKDESSDEEGDSGSDDEQDSEDSDESKSSSAGEKSDDGSNDEEDQDAGSEDESGDSDVDNATKKKLIEVLRAAGAAQESDESSEEVDGFDDEKMFELDVGLAKVAKEIQAAQEAAKRKRLHKMTPLELQASEFRMRLLSLVDIYVENQPENSSVLLILWPLVRMIDALSAKKSQAPILVRIFASISRIMKTKSQPPRDLDSKTIDTLHEILMHCYASFNQPATDRQVETRNDLIVYLQKVLLSQNNRNQSLDIGKIHQGFHTALKAYADSSQVAIRTRSLYVDLYVQILRRNPLLQFQLLKGVSETLCNCRDGPTRSALVLALYSTLTKNIVAQQVKPNVVPETTPSKQKKGSTPKKASKETPVAQGELSPTDPLYVSVNDFDNICVGFRDLLKKCFSDPKTSTLHRKELLGRGSELFKIMLSVHKDDLEACQKLWKVQELEEFMKEHPGKNAVIFATPLENFLTYIKTGKARQVKSKYASVEEKLKAKQERREKRKLKAEAKSTKSKDTTKTKSKKSKDTTLSESDKMDVSEGVSDSAKASHGKKRKEPTKSLEDSQTSEPKKKLTKTKK